MNISRLLFRLLLGRRLPVTNGTLEVRSITRPVLIRRDGYGIPYIEAEGDEDAWYGLGFCYPCGSVVRACPSPGRRTR